MKKSNKLILGGFLTLLLFITAIHVSLYAKYKAGDYSVYNAEDDLPAQALQSFPNILFVSVRNIPGATVRFSDVAQVEKADDGSLQFTRTGDTLQITSNADQKGFRRPVTFYLPYNTTISVFNSSLVFEAGKRMVQNNPVIYLQKSHAIFPGEQSPLQLGHLQIIASDSSLALLQGNTRVDQLAVQLSNSAIESTTGQLGQLSIVTDSLSRISLPAKQLLTATIKTNNPE